MAIVYQKNNGAVWTEVLWGVAPVAQGLPVFRLRDDVSHLINEAPSYDARSLVQIITHQADNRAEEAKRAPVKQKAHPVSKKVEASDEDQSDEDQDTSEATPGRSGQPPIHLLPDAPRAWYEASRQALKTLKGAQRKALHAAMGRARDESWRLYDEQTSEHGGASDLLSAAPF